METINRDFEQELQQLRQRLEEAEDMRRAITSGEVDAFVVGPAGNTRVLLLANAYQRYRQLAERMQQGALTATPNGQILFANQRFADLLGVPLAQLYTAPLESYVALGDRAPLSRFLMLSARESTLEVELSRRDGTSIPVRISMASFSDGYATLLITDLRPLQWPSLALEALDSIRTSLEKLGPKVAGDDAAREALREISGEINGLARMFDEMLDVEGPKKRP
jgi:PAS domain S-box-containing protein